MTTDDTITGDRAVPLPEPNIPLLRKVIDWAEAEATKPADQRLWRQGQWAQETDCGTAYCIAGYAVMASVSGADTHAEDDGYLRLLVDGEHESWGEIGRTLLGLTLMEAHDLFESRNSIRDVRRVAEGIAARSGDRL